MNLNERISALRKHCGLSQEDVAEALGISRQAVSKWETGRSFPDTENLLKLAALFGVTADALIKPENAGAHVAANRGLRGMWLAVFSAAVVIAAAIFVLLKFGVADRPSPDNNAAPPVATSIATSFPSADMQSGAVPSGTPTASADTALEVYLAYLDVSSESAASGDSYKSRLTIYGGLRTLDWNEFSTYGEAGRDTDTRMALLNWLAVQDTLSADELSGLIAGMNNKGIDGAYCEPYAQALSNALIIYPVQFIQGLASLDDAEYARQVAHMAIYGASYRRLDEAKAAVDSAVSSGTLGNDDYVWAVCLKDRCAWWSAGGPDGQASPPTVADSDFVRINDYIPDLTVDLKYATAYNFTGEVIYDFTDAWLRYGTVKKLAEVQSALTAQGYRLMVWDAYRPVSAQFKLWEVYPDPNYVADPTKGCSSHSKGNTVDVTLLDYNGNSVLMPSEYDDFSKLADRDYSDADLNAAANARLLEAVMTACGFTGYAGEWWHFTDMTDYPVDKSFSP